MDFTSPHYFEAPPLFASQGEEPLEGCSNWFYGTQNDDPFVATFPDPLCKLNLKETSEFVKAFPVANNVNGSESGGGGRGFSAQRRRREGVTTKRNVAAEAPPTPGRPIFSFSVGNNLSSTSRNNFPSKWDDAQKWLFNGHYSPAHHQSKLSKQCNRFKPQQEDQDFAEKSRVTEENVSSKAIASFQRSISLNHHNSVRMVFNGGGGPATADVLPKDKFTNKVEPSFPNYRCLEPTKEGFLFGNSTDKSMKEAATEAVHEVKHRDIGTEMSPLGSSTTSRCHTPFKSSSPARHNTPANGPGPLALTNSYSINNNIDISQFQECHLAKLQLGTQYDSVSSNWSSREEEEEEISKSLRHFKTSNDSRKSVSESRAYAWEEEEKTKCCLGYQREEAKIQAWVNLQNAKADAQSRKLEVKIQKMGSNLEGKLMKRMAIVHRKAEELRAAAQLQHTEQIQRSTQAARKTTVMNRQKSHFSGHNNSCGCFPCSNHHQ